jgi:tetratricopeptide (TPR) repeat protein
MRRAALIGLTAGVIAGWAGAAAAAGAEADRAYSLNQEAMAEMSQAAFESAADKFLRAAAIVPDYAIEDRPLRYTPTFMAAWAYEKLGAAARACRYYGRFLEIAPADRAEPTKLEHARAFVDQHCGRGPA